MKIYKDVFSQLKRQGRPALVPFFVVGDPDFDRSLALVKAGIDAGADILELGIPFSDPIADGPTIQKADVRALQSGQTIARSLEFIRRVKAYRDIPIGLLMYYNLIFQYGIEKFFRDFHAAGVNSVLVADLAIDDADEVAPAARDAGLDTVFMVTPNTAPDRAKHVAERTTGFIYAVSLLGVTGTRAELSQSAEGLIIRLKKMTTVPVCVGFGISTAEHAVAMAEAGADGVIIGSKIVSLIEENLDRPDEAIRAVTAFLRDVKTALPGHQSTAVET